MKKIITKRIMSIFLIISTMLALSSCGTTTVVMNSELETSGDGVSATVSSKEEQTGSSQVQSSDNNETSSGKVNSATTNVSGKLSRDQVMAKMPKNLKGTTLTYMYWWDPKTQMEKEAIEGFEKATGCKVKTIVASYSDFQSELNSKIASGNAPDLVRQIGNAQWMVANLQPITNSGFQYFDEAWDDWIMDQYTFNGKCYAANLKDSAALDVAVMYYNKTALKSADMDNEDPYKLWKSNPAAWTWEKFWSMCDSFVKAKNKSGYYGATFEYYEAYVRAMGGSLWDFNSKTGKYEAHSTDQVTVDGWKKTIEAYEKNWLSKEVDTASFDRNRILFYWSGPYSARKADARQSDLKKSNSLGVVPIPTDSKNTTLYELTAFGIPQGAKNAALAPYYIRYVMDRKSYNWKNVYYNEQARDVLDTVVSSGNFFYGHAQVQSLRNDLLNSGVANVKTALDSYSSIVNEEVKSENERMSKLPQ